MLRSTKLPNVFRSTSLREARRDCHLIYQDIVDLDPLASGRLDMQKLEIDYNGYRI